MLGIYGEFIELITNLIYICILVLAIIGYILFNHANRKQIAFWWVSLMGNIVTYLYLSGSYGLNDLVYYARIFVAIAWPIINIGWLVSIILTERKKTKNNQTNNLKKTIFVLAGIIFVAMAVFYLIISNFTHRLISGV